MWTTEQWQAHERRGLRYPSDLTDAEWALVEPFIPPARRGGRRRTVDVREVLRDPLRAGDRLPVARPAQEPAAEARRDLTLVIGRLEDFSTKAREGLDLLDWAARCEVIRLMVRRIEVDHGQIEIVFRIPPPSRGGGGDGPGRPRQHCTGERRAHLRLARALPQARQGLREPGRQRARLPLPRHDPPHAAAPHKALSRLANLPDGLFAARTTDVAGDRGLAIA